MIALVACPYCARSCHGTVGYLSFGPIEKIFMFSLTLSVREKDLRAARQAFERMHNTLSHGSKTSVPRGSLRVVVALTPVLSANTIFQPIVSPQISAELVFAHCRQA